MYRSVTAHLRICVTSLFLAPGASNHNGGPNRNYEV